MAVTMGCGGSGPESDNSPLVTESPSASNQPDSLPETAASTANVTTESNVVSTAASLDAFVPADTALAVSLKPLKSLKNPLVSELIKIAADSDPRINVNERLKMLKSMAGIDAEDIERLVVCLSEKAFDQAEEIANSMKNGSTPNLQVVPVVLVQVLPGTDLEKVINALPNPKEPYEVQGGDAYQLQGNGVVYFPEGQNLVVFAPLADFETLIKGNSSGVLTDRIQAAAANDVGLAVNFEVINRAMKTVQSEQPNFAFAIISGILDQLQALDLVVDLEAETLLRVTADAVKPESADALKNMLEGQLKQYRAGLENSQSLPLPNKQADAIHREILDGASVSVSGSTLTLAVPRPSQLSDLPTALAEMIKAKKMEAEQMVSARNELKQIGLAFHNYHAAYKSFPAVDSNGDKDHPRGKGLSWRVHLLPFLEQAALYDQFNLEEPWDSEQNKSLIEKMPAVFGSDPTGKTAIHVFVGENLLFETDKPGASFRDITDGTSNTILAVSAGDDTADFWTKPGGLEFQPGDPISLLGNVDEPFQVIFCDGSVRAFSKTVDPTTLDNLIQPRDGQVIQLDR